VLISPTYVPDLVNVALDLLIDEERGVWHLANQGAYTWVDLARRVADLAGLGSAFVVPKSMQAFGLPAARPRYSVLESQQGNLLPSVDDRLEECAAQVLATLQNTPAELLAVAS
jgi:dTDP-4-dehydrorhamnose reductase